MAMLRLAVALPSGRGESFSLPQSSTVGDLRTAAQKFFQQGFLKLVKADGHILGDPLESLQAAGLQDGDHLTALRLAVNLTATLKAFALWCEGGGAIVTWGDPDCGADSSAIQDQLQAGVQQVRATPGAFAAILADAHLAKN